MDNRGIGEYQTSLRIKNRMKILKLLKDGQWHRYSEIKEKTQLSPPIISSHLKELKEFIEKKEGEKDFRFTFYRANPRLDLTFFEADLIDSALKDIENQFLKTKDLAFALKMINAMSNVNMLIAFDNIKEQTFDINNPKFVQVFLETFVWESYKMLTSKLVALWMKFKDDIDLYETTIKITETEPADAIKIIEDLIHRFETTKEVD